LEILAEGLKEIEADLLDDRLAETEALGLKEIEALGLKEIEAEGLKEIEALGDWLAEILALGL